MSQMPSDALIETTAGDVAAELNRRGIAANEPVLVVRLSEWLDEVRRESRARVIAAGLTDDDIDQLIKEARKEVQHLIK
jgi:hypothetical protein